MTCLISQVIEVTVLRMMCDVVNISLGINNILWNSL
jgi:hypothetical protein